jgi:putative ABC transport system permease protein
MAVFRRIANLFRRSRIDREIEAELQSHIALRIDDNLARGMSAAEARRDALLRFGNPTATRERVTAADTTLSLNGFTQDLHYALRQLRRSPGFAITATLALALGIGPNVAIFSIIWATFLAPLPYPNGNELVVVWNHYKGERVPTTIQDFAYFAARARSFQRLDYESRGLVHLTSADASQVEIAGVPGTPGSYTKDLGIRIALGRDFFPDEGSPGRDHVLVMTNSLWRERYYADPQIIGKFVSVDLEPYEVVGVLAPSPLDRGSAGLFAVPILPGTDARTAAGTPQHGNITGRLKPGVTIAQAQAEMTVIEKQLIKDRGWGRDGDALSIRVEAFKNDWLDQKLRRSLWLLLAAVGLVLLIACANVANLQLARAVARRQEIAARLALGATRRQIFTQLLTESLMLALIGGALGVALGWTLMKMVTALVPDLFKQSQAAEVGLNLYVLGFAVLVTVLAAVVSGCAPGLQATRVNLSGTLKQGTQCVGKRTRVRMQSVLVISEFTLAMILLAGAGMALHSFWNLTRIDLGFTADHVVTGFLGPLNTSRTGRLPMLPPEQVIAKERALLSRLSAVPGTSHAALTTHAPLTGFGEFPFSMAGQPSDPSHPLDADLNIVTPDYFKTFGIRLVRGRFLNEGDAAAASAVVVNGAFVRRYLGNADPLTQHLRLPLLNFPGRSASAPPLEYPIVGVVHDMAQGKKLTDDPQPEMWVSMWQFPSDYVSFAVRTSVDPEAMMGSIRKAVAASGYKPDKLRTMKGTVESLRSSDRFEAALLAGFAALALLLAAVGILGLMTFVVAQRTHEIGVRMALGARRSDVVALVVRSGMRLATVGTAIGLVGALTFARVMQSTLYGVHAIDMGSLSAVVVLLLGVAVLACWIPARRSARIDPMRVLREE